MDCEMYLFKNGKLILKDKRYYEKLRKENKRKREVQIMKKLGLLGIVSVLGIVGSVNVITQAKNIDRVGIDSAISCDNKGNEIEVSQITNISKTGTDKPIQPYIIKDATIYYADEFKNDYIAIIHESENEDFLGYDGHMYDLYDCTDNLAIGGDKVKLHDEVQITICTCDTVSLYDDYIVQVVRK